MNPSEDKPRLEVFPWNLVILPALFWAGIWFLIWATLRGTVAAWIISFSSIRNLSYFPWLVPGQMALWLAALAWLFHDLKADKNPPLFAWALCFFLPLTIPPTAFYMLRHIRLLSEYELTHDATSLFFQRVLQGKGLDVAALVLTLPIGAAVHLRMLRTHFPSIRPQKRGWIAVGWAIAVGFAIVLGYYLGILWGILSMAVLGNWIAVLGYRATIRRDIQKSIYT